MQNVELQLLQGLLSLLAVAVTGAVGYLVPHAKDWLKSHVFKNNSAASTVANEVIDGLTVIAHNVVQSFNQKVVTDAKNAGTWTPELAASVKNDAVQAVLSQGSALVSLGYKVVGDVPNLVETLVEAAVNAHKTITSTPVQTATAQPIGTPLNPTL